MLTQELKEKYGDTMTPKDAAAVLNQHPNHIRELCQQGTLPSIKIGERWRIPTAKFAAIIEGCNE